MISDVDLHLQKVPLSHVIFNPNLKISTQCLFLKDTHYSTLSSQQFSLQHSWHEHLTASTFPGEFLVLSVSKMTLWCSGQLPGTDTEPEFVKDPDGHTKALNSLLTSHQLSGMKVWTQVLQSCPQRGASKTCRASDFRLQFILQVLLRAQMLKSSAWAARKTQASHDLDWKAKVFFQMCWF